MGGPLCTASLTSSLSPVPLLTYSLTHPRTYTRLLTPSLTHPRTYLFAHSIAHSPAHQLICSLHRSPTTAHSPTHPLTPALTAWCASARHSTHLQAHTHQHCMGTTPGTCKRPPAARSTAFSPDWLACAAARSWPAQWRQCPTMGLAHALHLLTAAPLRRAPAPHLCRYFLVEKAKGASIVGILVGAGGGWGW